MKRERSFGAELAVIGVAALVLDGCWWGRGRVVVYGEPPPAQVTVVAAPPPPSGTVVVQEQPPPSTVVVQQPPPRATVVVEGNVPPPRVFVRIAGVPSDYPDFVPFYPVGTVIMSARGGEHGKRAYVLQMMTNDSPDAVVAFYKSQMGVEPTVEAMMGMGRMIVYADKYHRTKFSVTISGNGGQTMVLLAAETDVP